MLNKYFNKLLIALLFITLVLTRFYDLAWGAPYFFHPDERNIASSISQLHFPDQLNPHFFAYGSLPIYLTYIVGAVVNLFLKRPDVFAVNFELAILVLRVISAVFSISISLFLIPVTRILLKKNSLVPFALSVFSAGLIQYAHFGTFEMYLTFFALVQFFFLLKYITTQKTIFFRLSVFAFAVLVSVKVSSLLLFPLPVLVFIFIEHRKHNFMHFSLKSVLLLIVYLKRFLQLSIFSLFLFLITSPYAILDFKSFAGSINYESLVALGTLPVFYTGGFYASTPLLYQFFHVYSFLLNPLITALLLPAMFFVFFTSFKKRHINLFLLSTFSLIFISNSMLFVKWTRYVVPTLPFVYLIVGLFLRDLFQLKNLEKLKSLKISAITILIFASVVFSFSFIKTVYINKDTRLEAFEFAKKNIPSNSRILSEVYDLGIIPFNDKFSDIKLFNFYDLDVNSDLKPELETELQSRNYIILPSQRIYKSRTLNPQKFPEGNKFYSSLSTDKYELLFQTPCDIFCKVIYLNDPIFSFEETANVFDRPTVFIYKISK